MSDSGKAEEVNSRNHQVPSLKTPRLLRGRGTVSDERTEVRVSNRNYPKLNSSSWSDSVSREEEVPDSGKAEEVNSRNQPVSSLNSSPASSAERICEQKRTEVRVSKTETVPSSPSHAWKRRGWRRSRRGRSTNRNLSHLNQLLLLERLRVARGGGA